MKYLFIFLPIFMFAQGSTLYGTITPVGPTLDTCWQIKDGYMSLKPGCTGSLVDHVRYGGLTAFQELYLEDRSFEVIDSFRYNGAYYELRNNGWHKKILPDTLPKYGLGEHIMDTRWHIMGNLRVLKPGRSTYNHSGVETWHPGWTPCNQHFGEADHPKRDKIEQSEVKLLVWNGCSLQEVKATKFFGYNYSDNSFWVDDTIKVKDFITWYIAGDRWIKPSHVIKEL
jgi:hypothetical protein